MRILMLTHSFNSLSQRLFVELEAAGYDLSVEFDIHHDVTSDAIDMFRPDVILAPFLKRKLPENIYTRLPCLIVHPGIPGDKGPAALDWAILNQEQDWGVTVLQANDELDGGHIWAWRTFPMRAATKGSLYRNELTEAAVGAVFEALGKLKLGASPVIAGETGTRLGQNRAALAQADRQIDWGQDSSDVIVRKIRAADGFPGVLDNLHGALYYLHDAHLENTLRGEPGQIIATCKGAICRATVDGAVWIGRLRAKPATPDTLTVKQQATAALGDDLPDVPDLTENGHTLRDIWFEERDGIGYLHFPFHNGAMDTAQCQRLKDAFAETSHSDCKVIVLMGGTDFWSNGIHLATIEAAENPAEESLRNIEAMDDLCEAIIRDTDRVVIAAMRGNAGAGGVFFALCADLVWARDGVVLNPHYKNMGNLYGSEYWTYLLPRRVGDTKARQIMAHRLPIGIPKALEEGLVNAGFGMDVPAFDKELHARALKLDAEALIQAKRIRREQDEETKPLAAYRTEELSRMKQNFFGFDPGYHVARYNFIYKVPKSHTPLYLASHRQRKGAA